MIFRVCKWRPKFMSKVHVFNFVHAYFLTGSDGTVLGHHVFHRTGENADLEAKNIAFLVAELEGDCLECTGLLQENVGFVVLTEVHCWYRAISSIPDMCITPLLSKYDFAYVLPFYHIAVHLFPLKYLITWSSANRDFLLSDIICVIKLTKQQRFVDLFVIWGIILEHVWKLLPPLIYFGCGVMIVD